MIVSMQAHHIVPMAEMETLCFSAPFTVAMLEEEYKNPNTLYWVDVLPNGTLRGYAGFQIVLDEGHIVNVAVAPAWRRQGVATALIERIFERARALGLTCLMLEVRVGNTAAQCLYRRFGFEVVGRRKDYYTDPREDALLMTWRSAS